MVLIANMDDPVVSDVTSTLQEWHQIWLALYLDNQRDLFERISAILVELLDLRDEILELIHPQILSSTSHDSINRFQLIHELKATIVGKIDLGNRMLGLDLVLRDHDFRPVDPIKLSPIKLYHLHTEAAANLDSSSNFHDAIQNHNNGCHGSTNSTTCSSIYSLSQTGFDSQYSSSSYQNQNSHHLQLSIQNHQLHQMPPDELLEVYISVVEIDSTSNSSNQIIHISEKFLFNIKDEQVIDKLPKTIFTNIGQIKDKEIALLLQVYRVGRMILPDGLKTSFGKQSGSSNTPLGIYSDLTNASTKFLSDLPRSRHSAIGNLISPLSTYRRPFGSTFVVLNGHQNKNSTFKEIKSTVKIFMVQNELEFPSLLDLYFKKNQSKFNQSQPNLKLDLSMRFLTGPIESISRLTTFELNEFCLTDKRGFPDVVMPGDFKNDLYFTIESAEFEKGGKSISKNIEASISLIDRSGLVIDNSIVPASNCDKLSSYKSCIYYHTNTPRWNEEIKINVPLAEFDKSHIRIEFRHCSTKDREKKFIGFAFLPLSYSDGTVVSDGTHELFLYKCDLQSFEDESMNLRKYMSLPYGPKSRNSRSTNITNNFGSKQNLNQNFTHSNREVVTVSTFLLSTKLTQNSTLLNLLRWRELVNNQDFEDTLNNVFVLKGEEIVKFLQDILDTLFDTFTLYLNSQSNNSALIFKVLIHIFLLLDDPKYQHFKPVLDSYASAHFSATLVYKGLLACVKKCLEYSSVVESRAPIQGCFKAIRYVFQFAVQSRILFSEATGEQDDEQFLTDLRHLFKLFENMLSHDDKNAIPLQETFLESFPGALEQLMRVMDTHELAQVVTSLAGSVGFILPPQLSRAKLVFMRGVAESSLLTNQDVRMKISEIFCRHLMSYIKNSVRPELCYEVLEILISTVHDNHWPSIYRLHHLSTKSHTQHSDHLYESNRIISIGEINIYSKTGVIQANQLDLAITNVSKELDPFVKLMGPLLLLLDKLVRDLNNDRPVIQRYCNCLLTILKLMGRTSFDQFIVNLQIDYRALCELFKSLRAVYHRDWSIMQLTSHAILEHPIDEISKIKFNQQPSSYIHLIVDFITHPTLQLEVFSDKKKSSILNIFGDLRLKFGSQLMRFWRKLSINKIGELIPTSLQSFLDAALLPNEKVQHMLMPVFYDMMDADYQAKSNLRLTDRYFVDHLDLFMNLDRGNLDFVKNFEAILTSLIEERSPVWKAQGLKLVSSITQLMRLLIEYRQSLEVYEGKSKHMSCLVELLIFYRDQERIDIYLKYLFKLCDIHLDANHHTEAAFTLRLYADELRWCNRNLSALEGFRPDEQEWKRKEALYHRIIHYFDLGKCWEESISMCKELASFYENYLVDYEKVSHTLKKLAHLLDKILLEHRPEIEYFRVEFLGSDQPDYVRGKELIYRGGYYERLAAFIERISSEFHGSRVLNAKERKSMFGDLPAKNCAVSGQYLVISNVKPVPSLQDNFKLGHRAINDKIIHYYLNNRLDTFSYDLPIVKGDQKDRQSEMTVRNLWVGRCVLKLKKQLPDILPWSEVISRDYIEISPIANAIETVSAMNLELSKLILSYTKEPGKQLSPLTMRLQGVLEAAVNGGPALIINAFFKRPQQDEIQSDQHHAIDNELLIKLRGLIKQQFTTLEQGLGLHLNLAPPEVMPLHKRLVERLCTLRKSFEEETASVENNYETLYPHTASHHTEKTAQINTNATITQLNGLDEIDGNSIVGQRHRDANGNVCIVSEEDQIYSHPIEPKLDTSLSNHQKSTGKVTNSPLQSIITGSSSLSTLTILGNMPLNHRARVSMTPSKEMNATLYRGNTAQMQQEETTEMRVKAARRLTYDSNRLSSDLSKSLTLGNRRQADDSDSQKESAPPLPPRVFSHDRHIILKQQPDAKNPCESEGSLPQPEQDLAKLVLAQPRATTNNRL